MIDNIIMFGASLLAVAVIVYMLIKKMDIKMALFSMGIVLLYVSLLMGHEIALEGFESTGSALLDPLEVIVQQFKSTLTSAGIIILILGGYTGYMSSIGANNVTVQMLTKPMNKIKSVYILVPIIFLLGNLLSLVVPSASTLAILLLATLYPVLKNAGMSPLSIAAVIATSATIIPTPLGSDNVAIAEELAKHAQFADLTVTQYVFNYHALISLPTLAFIAVVHYFWQKRMDKKASASAVADESEEDVELEDVEEIQGGKLYKTVYAILPIFPIVLLLLSFALDMATDASISISVEVAVFISFIVAIVCELIRQSSGKEVLANTEEFFKGMGNMISVVALIVAASVFVTGLQSLGLINTLQEFMEGIQGQGFDFVLPLILVGFTALIVLLSGSGIALFFAMVPLMVPLAQAAGIDPLAITVPMGLAGNLFRSVSPVAAVVLIIAGTLKLEPLNIIKRTSVPMISGVIFMFILSMIMFL